MAGTSGSSAEEPTKKEEEECSRSGKALRSFFGCRDHNDVEEKKSSKKAQICCSGSLCSLTGDDSKNVMMQRRELATAAAAKGTVSASAGKAASRDQTNRVLTVSTSSSSSSSSSLVRGMYMSRLTGCHECSIAMDPVNGFSRASVCPDCGEMFAKAESLDLHQALRHAVSELGPEDTSRSIVEIIFQSSWLKKQTPVCKIERILKIHNTKKTTAAFEDYRDSVRSRASKLSKKHPRCIADGNELLRFYCTSSKCSLGLNGSTSLCDWTPHCKVCSIIRDGMKADAHGRIEMMSTSGRAHDAVRIEPGSGEKRAMLVCRVIAGRVRKSQDGRPDEEFDSVAGTTGAYSNLDELCVFNPKSILPCFVVIYIDA